MWNLQASADLLRQRLSRRQALQTTSAGFGYLALAGLLGQNAVRTNAVANEPSHVLRPLAPKTPHFEVKAKRIIFLFMEGAASQLDTWEYKPQLQQDGGKVGPGGGLLTASKFQFRPHGQTGTWLSELLPNMSRHVDDLCFLRGLHTDTPAHPQAVIQLHTGTALASLTRPSMGAWLMYGLGTENEDLPGYVTVNPSANFGGSINFGSAFLPAHFQGTRINDVGFVPNLKAQTATTLQRKQLDLLQAMNRDLVATPGAPDQLEGVIQSFELAFKMQGKVPELLDISKEPQSMLDAYGVKPGPAGSFARQCLMARRLSEAGVRFVEICHPGWDQHGNLHRDIIKNTGAVDQPTAALLDDLGQRGLLDDTSSIRQRVRSDADCSRPRRPGSQHHRLSHVAGRSRRQEGFFARSDRRVRSACRRKTHAHNRPARDPVGVNGARSREPDLSLRRPRLPSHGRRWQRGPRGLRLTLRSCGHSFPSSTFEVAHFSAFAPKGQLYVSLGHRPRSRARVICRAPKGRP